MLFWSLETMSFTFNGVQTNPRGQSLLPLKQAVTKWPPGWEYLDKVNPLCTLCHMSTQWAFFYNSFATTEENFPQWPTYHCLFPPSSIWKTIANLQKFTKIFWNFLEFSFKLNLTKISRKFNRFLISQNWREKKRKKKMIFNFF